MFASLGTSRLIGQKEKPTKKVVVLISRRNGVDKIKYCPSRKRQVPESTDNQSLDRNAVEEWLEKNIDYAQRIEKRNTAVKKKKQFEPTTESNVNAPEKCDISRSSENDDDSEDQQDYNVFYQPPQSSSGGEHHQRCLNNNKIRKSSFNSETEVEFSYPFEVRRKNSGQREDFDRLPEQFKQELNRYKQMTEKLHQENEELKNKIASDHISNQQMFKELHDDNKKLVGQIEYLEQQNCQSKERKKSIETLSNTEMIELISELERLKLESENTLKEEKIYQMQEDTEELKCNHDAMFFEEERFQHLTSALKHAVNYKRNVEETKQLLEHRDELEKELKDERSRNEWNLEVIEFLKKKFVLKTEDWEKIIVQVDLENFNKTFKIKSEITNREQELSATENYKPLEIT